MNHRFIAIEGNIGAGKTTLSQLLSQHYNAKLVLEEFAENPFLTKFYENPKQYAFPLELFFLAERFKQQQELVKNKDLFQITYENIYINKVDIDRVLSYLHIEKPKHLDMLDYGKKYRTDTFTLNYDFKRKNII